MIENFQGKRAPSHHGMVDFKQTAMRDHLLWWNRVVAHGGDIFLGPWRLMASHGDHGGNISRPPPFFFSLEDNIGILGLKIKP